MSDSIREHIKRAESCLDSCGNERYLFQAIGEALVAIALSLEDMHE